MTDLAAVAQGVADREQLARLGIKSAFDRRMTKWENFALGFTYLSPVVAVYSLFGSSLAAGGPPMIWTFVLVGILQYFVALVFGEVVSQFPISGGLYPWTRRLVGKRWAWMTGVIYAAALCVSIAAVATGGAPFVARLIGISASGASVTALAIAMIGLTTIINVLGTRLLSHVAMFGFVCELIGAVAVGGYLMFFGRHQSPAIVFDSFGAGEGGSYFVPFITSALGALFCYYGFEACGDVAEETPDPGRTIPQAMRMTIYIGGIATTFVTFALLLALPDVRAAISSHDPDTVGTILKASLGETGYRVVCGIVLVSFVSCVLSLQAAASRLVFAFARDRMMPLSATLSRLSIKSQVPVNSLVLVGLVPCAIALLGLVLANAVTVIISFAVIGIYISFQMLVFGALIARVRGWRPSGAFNLGAWGWPVNIIAFIGGVSGIVNIAWPRQQGAPWYVDYMVLLTSAVVVGVAFAFMVIFKPYDVSDTASGDAHLLSSRTV